MLDREMVSSADAGAIKRSRAIALWRQVQAELEREILTGAVAPGDRLPTELELSTRFNVHRHTIRRAVDTLREKQLVRVEHGHGIYVRERTIPYSLSPDGRLSTTLRQLSRTNDRRMLATKKVCADNTIAKALLIRAGQPVRRVDLLSGIDGVPVTLSQMYFPLPRFSGIEKHIDKTGSITSSLSKLGVQKYQRRETRVSARLPSRCEAELLDQARTQPVLTVYSLDVDDRGSPIAYSHSCLSTRWIELVVRF
ncbi:phosphonate metabolism transcriptional regulator PhnF [Bradyrhizobium sp. SSUT77]|uniref:phosphonate metabolism transcriptional regulator PhnF n=1 Tax=Bradyrhizobium sp. SSUT77 TaxID=3040603 RepID=UPI00244C7BC5|nr:phosphonate metabolism transcriptional regulator PhnF [Bradyrhizobium sp. SSUT77]MDH2347751.1 phosphonate metabolism transcriptional regulator PhnF [Bradyrhizobium sp. SSUT77]